MKKLLLKLQMFAEGGGESGSSAAVGEGATSEGTKGKGNPLSDIIYGKQIEDSADPTGEVSSTPKSKSQAFEDLIKGEYKEEFTKRTQNMINKRFKESKQMEETLRSHDSILSMLSEKYGVDASDVSALQAAIEDDESFYQQEAFEKGLSVEQLKEVKRLERENKAFRDAEAEAERRANSDRIYAQWTQEADAMAAKYGLTDFSLDEEVQNPDFTRLLASGISVESAYKAIHMDEMIGGAMAKTASTVKDQLAQSLSSRASRPSENGVSSSNSSQIFKPDVNSLTKADREEIERRVMRGAIISF